MAQKWLSSAPVLAIGLLSLTLALSTSGKRPPESGQSEMQPAMSPNPTSPSSPLPPWSNFHRGRSRAITPKSHHPTSGPILFDPAIYPSGGVYAFSVAVGDFNGDGNADLAVANQCADSSCSAGAVTVLLGNGDGTFQSAQSYLSGGYEAYAVAVGDVSNDGKADLIVASACQSPSQCTNGVVAVLLGNGNGTFQTGQTYSTGGVVASSVTMADVNRDGNLDLLVANQCLDSTCANGGVSVLLGNGDGTFQAAQSYASGGLTAVSVAVGNFRGGKKVDLVVANECTSNGNCNGNVGVLLGNGDGTFQAAQNYASGGYTAVSVAVGDFNEDRKTDLVVANQCQASGDCTHGNVGVLLGKGDGTFVPAQTYASGGNNTAAVATGDFNQDGRPDLVLANQCQSQNNCPSGSVSVLLGNGDGTFQAAQNYLSDGVFAYSVGVGDWNGDEKPDLVVVNQCQSGSNCSGTLTVLMGNGDGTFQARSTYPSGAYDADAVAVGDLNRDGKLDLVVANFCQSNNCDQGNNGQIRVLLGNGDGTFGVAHDYATKGFGSASVAIHDLNGDGNPDVVVANQCSTSDCKGGGSLSILLGNGDGTLQPAQTYPSGAYISSSVAIADFNKDGNLDLAVTSRCQDDSCRMGAVSVLLGNGKGSFQPAQIFPSGGYYTNSVAIADFNLDGNPDLALTSQCQDSTCQNGSLSVLLGNGNGTFQSPQTYNSGGAQADAVVTAQMNGDGNPDLVVLNLCVSPTDCSSGIVVSFIGQGDGTFRPSHPTSTGGSNAYSVVAGDFNGDGYTDVVVANSDGTCVLLGNGNGTFQAALPYLPGGIFLSTGDFSGDSKPDVAVTGGSLSTVTVLLNVATGYRWATATTLKSSPNPSAVNQSVLFTASITTQYGGSPTGTVTFKEGTTTLGQGTVNNGQATLSYSFTSPDTDKIVASYSGDSNFLPSTSPPLWQHVTQAATITAVTSSSNPSQLGQSVKFTATVTAQYGGTPTGSVTFKDGQNVLAQVPLSGGVARYKTSTLTKGNHHIYANYGGDSNYRYSQGFVIQMVQ